MAWWVWSIRVRVRSRAWLRPAPKPRTDRGRRSRPRRAARGALPGSIRPATRITFGGSAMILIGQYDSPFVRRVAIALRMYGMAYEHRPWSVFGDADEIAAFNPLRRVPTLVADDGGSLVESGAILDWLDEQAGRDRALI